mmetsp:Transcript_9838/g.25274  ORF Transcript_9838/g.25274 Transcript_9838/m.25274 type:complete len:102 (-) Transcript_9838:1084-1389(-)
MTPISLSLLYPPPAAERSIFSKLLYLAELPEMVTQQEAEISQNLSWQILEIFGATSDDADKLRIRTLSELETEDLESLMGAGGAPEEEGEEASEESGTLNE